jgi:ABC-type dipeptide/oligopeptide/nickel transport system permease component
MHFKNALLPVITIIGIEVGVLFRRRGFTETFLGCREGGGASCLKPSLPAIFPIIQAFYRA